LDIVLQKVKKEDLAEVHKLQVESFQSLLEKYKDTIRISPMFIHPHYQNRKFGQEAVYSLEQLHSNVTNWTLDTILQEKKLCYFYEKLGYIDTGKRKKIKEGMDIIFYKKEKIRTAGEL